MLKTIYTYEISSGKITGEMLDKAGACESPSDKVVGDFVKNDPDFVIIRVDKDSELYSGKTIVLNKNEIKTFYIER